LKKWMLLVAILALVLVAAAPVIAQVAFEIGDAETESGEIGTENSFSVSGDNNSTCLGQLQFGNTGNFTNQQGTLQYASEGGPSLSAPSVSFGPSNGTSCDQAVQQSAAASSTF
jgi:hypothetical protein